MWSRSSTAYQIIVLALSSRKVQGNKRFLQFSFIEQFHWKVVRLIRWIAAETGFTPTSLRRFRWLQLQYTHNDCTKVHSSDQGLYRSKVLFCSLPWAHIQDSLHTSRTNASAIGVFSAFVSTSERLYVILCEHAQRNVQSHVNAERSGTEDI